MWPKSADRFMLYPHLNVHRRRFFSWKWICRRRDQGTVDAVESPLKQALLAVPTMPLIAGPQHGTVCDGSLSKILVQKMLRDLLYWSIFTDRIDMAKVILLHLRTRICGALSCAAILRNRSSIATVRDQREFYKQQAKDFVKYATDCINACYLINERKACELLICEQLLFGKITCMQVSLV